MWFIFEKHDFKWLYLCICIGPFAIWEQIYNNVTSKLRQFYPQPISTNEQQMNLISDVALLQIFLQALTNFYSRQDSIA